MKILCQNFKIIANFLFRNLEIKSHSIFSGSLLQTINNIGCCHHHRCSHHYWRFAKTKRHWTPNGKLRWTPEALQNSSNVKILQIIIILPSVPSFLVETLKQQRVLFIKVNLLLKAICVNSRVRSAA